jgi:ATP-dependent Lon protease
VANILQLLRLPDETIKVLVEGLERVEVLDVSLAEEGYLVGSWGPLLPEDGADHDVRECEVLRRSVLEACEHYIKLNKKIPAEVYHSLAAIEDPGQLADAIAAHLSMKLDERQHVLETIDPAERLEQVLALINGEMELLQIEKRIRGRVKQQMEKSQREYYLNEQMKAIQKEIGELEDSPLNEFEELARKIKRSGMPKAVREKAEAELNKLRMMSPMSAEATVVRNYIDVLLAAPWRKRTKVRNDLVHAQAILDEHHYGLEKVKERIIEHLAVQTRMQRIRGPILCLVGPPGVGKTSLGKSMAEAVNRHFIRVALGGIRDEAEIRGHRRTYIGSMPGKIIGGLSRIKVKNPVFLLDEIDKVGADYYRGDPTAALLEVLDPEQNNTFVDHYLEVEFDLSEVMFIATANTLDIPGPLLDRMEIIRIPGYSEEEKCHIAQKHLISKQQKANGLKEGEFDLPLDAVRAIIRSYTREAGIRGLEREIAKLCRKAVKRLLTGEESPVQVTAERLGDFLGVPRYRYGELLEHSQVGQVTGLAWTESGGEILTIEAAVMPGKGQMIYTGKLGDVMQESIRAATTVVRSRAHSLGIDPEFYSKQDIHIHVPEGATPKDGPSAGVAMVTALVSALTGVVAHADVAMTGEITLRGEILPVGGLKEKLLAAHRAGVRLALVPDGNQRELADIPQTVLQTVEIRPVRWIDQVFSVALERLPAPLGAEGGRVERAGEGSGDTIPLPH